MSTVVRPVSSIAMETRERWVDCASGMLIDLNTVAGMGQASTSMETIMEKVGASSAKSR